MTGGRKLREIVDAVAEDTGLTVTESSFECPTIMA